ncbi:hypothetical protein D3C71_1381100 [compost metagenome]
MACTGRNHHCAFHADKHPQGDQHGIFNLFPHRFAKRDAVEIQREYVHFEGNRRQDGKHP